MNKNANSRCKCKTLCLMLSDYVDDELSPSLCDRVEQHLAECEDCRKLVETLRGTVSLCHEYQPASLDPAIAEQSRAILLSICRETIHESEGKKMSRGSALSRSRKSRCTSCS